ncbi:MAG: PH domain-containing protein [Acetatifactor sp.]|nr:PH domain-containing protein [Acetatifactor sp.]
MKGWKHMIEFVERKRWVFFALPFTFTKYTIKEDVLTIQTGILKIVENDCYMYKIQDVQHSATLGERIFGIGTITCFTGDTTHPKLELMHIKNSRAIKDFILQQSEEARLKRRTVNTLDIGSGDMTDVDDM